MSGSTGGQRRTTPDAEPQAAKPTRQAQRGASWLRDEATAHVLDLVGLLWPE